MEGKGDQRERERGHKTKEQVGLQAELLRGVSRVIGDRALIQHLGDTRRTLQRGNGCIGAARRRLYPDLIRPWALMIGVGKRDQQRIAVEHDEVAELGIQRWGNDRPHRRWWP